MDFKTVVAKSSGEFPQMWNGRDLSVGEAVQGRYVELRENIGQNRSKVYIVATDAGTVGLWGSVVLDDLFTEVQVGKIVRVTYLGKLQGKRGGKPYKNYQVAVAVDEPTL